MSLRFLFLYTLALLPGWRTYAQDTTATRRPEYPMFQETPLFVGGQDNINTYRIPSVICTEKGTVLAFAEGRINSLTVRVSYDEGRTWPISRVIRKGEGAYSCMTVFPDGSIGIIYETNNCNNSGLNITSTYPSRVSTWNGSPGEGAGSRSER